MMYAGGLQSAETLFCGVRIHLSLITLVQIVDTCFCREK